MTRLTVVTFISLIALSLILVGQSSAAVDLDDAAGIWLFDEDANDSSGNNNHGTLVGNPQWVDGKFGKALKFNGTGDYVDTELNTNDLSSPITISLWMNAAQIKHSSLVSGYNGADPRVNRWDIQLDRGGDGKIRWIEHEGRDGAVSTTTIQTDTWYHIAVIHDLPQSESHIFVNGVLEHTAKIDQDLNTNRVVQFAEGDGDFYGGLMDDVVIFNVILTEDDINDIMKQGLKRMGTAVSPSGKLATTWSEIKKQNSPPCPDLSAFGTADAFCRGIPFHNASQTDSDAYIRIETMWLMAC